MFVNFARKIFFRIAEKAKFFVISDLRIPKYWVYPLPPVVYWNLRVSGNLQSNLWRSISCGQNLDFKQLRPDCESPPYAASALAMICLAACGKQGQMSQRRVWKTAGSEGVHEDKRDRIFHELTRSLNLRVADNPLGKSIKQIDLWLQYASSEQ